LNRANPSERNSASISANRIAVGLPLDLIVKFLTTAHPLRSSLASPRRLLCAIAIVGSLRLARKLDPIVTAARSHGGRLEVEFMKVVGRLGLHYNGFSAAA
jgi:hypothetical protein